MIHRSWNFQWYIQGKVFQEKVIMVSCSCFCFFSCKFHFVFLLLILFVCGNIELNLGPKNRNSCYIFSICHWSLNSITACNFAKVNLLQACNVIHDFDMICLSKSYLDSSVSSGNDNLYIKDYKLLRVDHPGNVKKRWCVCLF